MKHASTISHEKHAGSPCPRCLIRPRLHYASMCNVCRSRRDSGKHFKGADRPASPRSLLQRYDAIWARVTAKARPKIRPDIHERFERIKNKVLA